MSSLLLLGSQKRSVPFSTFFIAVFGLGALAAALADWTVGGWYFGSLLFAVVLSGGNLEGLKLNMPKGGTVTLIMAALGSLAASIIGASALTTLSPMSTIEMYNLVLPFADFSPALQVWSLGIQLIGVLISGIMLAAYLVYIAVNEEVVFRGSVLSIVDKGLSSKYKLVGRAVAIVGMACAFAYFHFIIRGTVFTWGPFLILTWLGLVWGVTSLATGSIWPTILAHTLWNFMAYLQRGIILSAIIPLAQISPLVCSVAPVIAVVGGISVLALWIRGGGRRILSERTRVSRAGNYQGEKNG